MRGDKDFDILKRTEKGRFVIFFDYSMHVITFGLLLIGGLNWLLVGAFQWDIGSLFGGQMEMVSRVIYILVGLSAIYELLMHKKYCKLCGASKSGMAQPM